MYARNAIADEDREDLERIPGSAAGLVFTSTSNTVAGIAPGEKKSPYH
jgi:hypothetical protein